MMAKSSKKTRRPRGDKYAHLRTNRLNAEQRSKAESKESQLEATLREVRSVPQPQRRPRKQQPQPVAAYAAQASVSAQSLLKKLPDMPPPPEPEAAKPASVPTPMALAKQPPEEAVCETCPFCPKRSNICDAAGALKCADEQEQAAYTEAFLAFIGP